MKHLALVLTLICYFNHHGYSQRIAPAPAQSAPLVITGGTIHIGNGQVIENGAVAFNNVRLRMWVLLPMHLLPAQPLLMQNRNMYIRDLLLQTLTWD